MHPNILLRQQNWVWALRHELGWPTFKPCNDCIAFSGGRPMDVAVGTEMARLATVMRKDMIYATWPNTTATEPADYVIALRELLTVDVIDRCFAYAVDEVAPIILVSMRKDEHFAIGQRGLLERREGKPGRLGEGRKLALKRIRATAATMGSTLSADNIWVPPGSDWVEPQAPAHVSIRFN